MKRAAMVAWVVGLAAAAGWIALAVLRFAVMPSYLAAWLFWMAVPLGALPLVMVAEAADLAMPPIVLRRALLLLPVGALLAIPVLLRTGGLFRRAGVAAALPAAWMAPGFFIGRAVVILLVLSLLAAVFSRPGRRQGLACLGLVLHLGLVSLAALDWVMAVQPGIGSSAFGLLVIAGQLGIAACLAALLLAATEPVVPAGSGNLLAVLLAGWAFLHFTQYLVVWSADLPAEIAWYQMRALGAGPAIVWFAVVVTVAGLVLLPSPLARRPAVLGALAGLLLLVHALEMLWLVTPAFRSTVRVTVADLVAMLGFGGVLVGLLLSLLPAEQRRAVA